MALTPLAVLRNLVVSSGSQRAAATQLDISESYVSDLLHGRRDISAKMLAKLGLRRVETYTRITEAR